MKLRCAVTAFCEQSAPERDYILPDQDQISSQLKSASRGVVMGDNQGNSDDSRIFGHEDRFGQGASNVCLLAIQQLPNTSLKGTPAAGGFVCLRRVRRLGQCSSHMARAERVAGAFGSYRYRHQY